MSQQQLADQTNIIEEQFWLYWNCDLLGYRKRYEISLDIIGLWKCVDKYIGEDETYMLFIINNMKKGYYKNSLAQNIIYYISG